MYTVKEIFYTLQGEGAHSGRAAVFMRFAGCNLWSGRESDRAKAQCTFCDTDFVGTDGVNGGKFNEADDLAARAVEIALGPNGVDAGAQLDDLLIVLTGGEPLLQVDGALIDALHKRGFIIAVETNGTIAAPVGIDWICVSPKAGTDIVQKRGNELKLVYGQEGVSPEEFAGWDFDHFYLQPLDHSFLGKKPASLADAENSDLTMNGAETCQMNDDLTKETIDYCKAHPQWKLSLQSHKILNIP